VALTVVETIKKELQEKLVNKQVKWVNYHYIIFDKKKTDNIDKNIIIFLKECIKKLKEFKEFKKYNSNNYYLSDVKNKNIDKDILQGVMEDTLAMIVRKKYGAESQFDIILNMDGKIARVVVGQLTFAQV
jgi:hypothetical protein